MEILVEGFVLSEDEIQGGVEGAVHPDPRPEGLHLSQLVNRMTRPKAKPDAVPPSPWYREMGFIWETLIDAVFKKRMQQHRRVTQFRLYDEDDDLHASPDGFLETLEEYKATWKKMPFRFKEDMVTLIPPTPEELALFTDKFWGWLAQIKGYARMMGCTEALLFALFVNGNYAPMVPAAVKVTLKFTPQELEENWEALMCNAPTVVKENGIKWLPKSQR